MLNDEILYIVKRDGTKQVFIPRKIYNSINKARLETNEFEETEINKLVYQITDKARYLTDVNVEAIQDIVEETLMLNKYTMTAKTYILYREKRSRIRNKKSNLMQTLKEITFSKSIDSDTQRENANVNSDTPMGRMLKYGSETAKEFNKDFVLSQRFADAHNKGDIHIHDLDFLTMTMTCCQIDLDKLFKGGFSTGHGTIREPQSIRTYASLACIAIQSNQNDQHGGQSIAKFDFDLAPGVIKTYKKAYVEAMQDFLDLSKTAWMYNAKGIINKIENKYSIIPRLYNTDINQYLYDEVPFSSTETDRMIKFVTNKAEKITINETHQAMELLIHNLNSMSSRAGAQVPFSSINYGTDTSHEGRLIVQQLLLATQEGLGEGETPIFPIQIFKVKEGVNLNPKDPNYDLFKLAIQTTSKRLFPNFSFLDAPFNKQYYKENDPITEVAYMGCRSRVMANAHDPEQERTTGRGNLSFTSINLPRLAILNKDVDTFFKALDDKLELVKDQLIERLEIQSNLKVYNFPFLMGQGVWIDSDKLNHDDEIREVIKHGSLGIGFIGLAETLKALIGEHHGESETAEQLGYKIIKHMRTKIDEMVKETKLNFSLIATPSEGLSGRFVKMDKELFGKIEQVTDREYYTNSFHVPVYYNISAYDKIRIEAPYHELTNGGHISYVEVDGDASKNPQALETIIRHMHKSGVGYGSINHAVDFDPDCGFVGVINEEFPISQ